MKKWAHNKKIGIRNLQSSPQPETRTTVISALNKFC